MTLPVTPPIFPNPPDEYDPKYMQQLIKSLQVYVQAINTPGQLECTNVVASKLPTSAAGLRAGTFYNDAGTVKVVL